MKTKKLKHLEENNKITVEVEGFKINYHKEIHIDYGSCGGFGSMQEMEEEIENRENSTHYLYLDGTEWKTIIHGYVDYDFYLKEDEGKKLLLMTFYFTGIGNSQRMNFAGNRDVVLGEILTDGEELKLTTEDGTVLVQKKEN